METFSTAENEFTLAPTISKAGAGSVPKRGAGLPGKSASSAGKGPKLIGDKTSKSSTKPKPSGNSLFPTSSGTAKSSSSYEPPSAYSSSKSNKTAFGIIWLPTRKHNKQKKDLVYNPHRDDKRDRRDRSPSMYNLMSGDSPDNLPRKRDEEAATLLMPERVRPAAPPVPPAVSEPPQPEPAPSDNADEKREFIQRDNKENKEAAGDSINDKEDEEYLDNDNTEKNKSPRGKTDDKNMENTFGDKVDSVYLRPPPPHKARSTTSTANDEESCGIKCLYYTLQCCDCVLM